MSVLTYLANVWNGLDYPFLVRDNSSLRFSDLFEQHGLDLSIVNKGDVVAIVGDFDSASILNLLRLIDRGAIVVPLTKETVADHDYYFESALVDVIVADGQVRRRQHKDQNELISRLRSEGHAGLVLFSTGTTGRPKAILHDLTVFLKRFETPRPTLRTLSFLLFDHIGGINTLLHTLYNKGVVVAIENRSVESVLTTCEKYQVEVLPTTPTFLRMMLMSGSLLDLPPSVKIITYGTERMDQPTLDELCRLLPNVDFRQTFGMSELGIVRAKSKSRNSLFMKIGGDGVKTRVINNVLHIYSPTRMLGYLNADSPFDDEGWYDTKDVVEVVGDFYKIAGRVNEVINVGGLKFMAADVERVALQYPGVELVKVSARPNPITGQHVELTVQALQGASVDSADLQKYLRSSLQSHMVPRRILFETVGVGHRFKRA